jgi:hypothetical protein
MPTPSNCRLAWRCDCTGHDYHADAALLGRNLRRIDYAPEPCPACRRYPWRLYATRTQTQNT